MKRSKNQVVWARCHLAGLASGMLCTIASSADSGAASATVRERVRAKRAGRSCTDDGADPGARGDTDAIATWLRGWRDKAVKRGGTSAAAAVPGLDEPQELGAGTGIVAERAQHGRGHHAYAALVHAAGGHALVHAFHHHAHADR